MADYGQDYGQDYGAIPPLRHDKHGRAYVDFALRKEPHWGDEPRAEGDEFIVPPLAERTFYAEAPIPIVPILFTVAAVGSHLLIRDIQIARTTFLLNDWGVSAGCFAPGLCRKCNIEAQAHMVSTPYPRLEPGMPIKVRVFNATAAPLPCYAAFECVALPHSFRS